jgi:hypothetical protein
VRITPSRPAVVILVIAVGALLATAACFEYYRPTGSQYSVTIQGFDFETAGFDNCTIISHNFGLPGTSLQFSAPATLPLSWNVSYISPQGSPLPVPTACEINGLGLQTNNIGISPASTFPLVIQEHGYAELNATLTLPSEDYTGVVTVVVGVQPSTFQ